MQIATYRQEYGEYYRKHVEPNSPAMRDPNPTVVLVPGIGMFTFGKAKPSRESWESFISMRFT